MYNIKCELHNYVTLLWDDEFITCYDNNLERMENIIEAIEKRTGEKFNNMGIKGKAKDFNGLRFGSGFKYDWMVVNGHC